MNTDNKPSLKLKIKSANNSIVLNKDVSLDNNETNSADNENDKKKGKRGRPRKNPLVVTEAPVVNMQAKKRGRKKKQEIPVIVSNTDNNKNGGFHSFITKNYIVQLKVKSSDLEKIQRQFMDKTQQIGYKPPTTKEPIANQNIDKLADVEETQKNHNYDEYYKLLNNLEMPLIPVADMGQQKINTTTGQLLKNNLPEVPDIYQGGIIVVNPENVPIGLFMDSDDGTNSGGVMQATSRGEFPKYFKNTTNILLPLLNLASGKWPETSPYPCWNCNAYFSGTPVGLVDKETNGLVYWYGNTCTFPCSARWMRSRMNDSDFWVRYSILNIQYQRVYGLSPLSRVQIPPEPEKCLFIYGGKLSYEQYHNYNENDLVIEIYKLPIMPVLLHIEEVSRSTDINKIIKNNQGRTSSAPKTQMKLVTQKKSSRYIPIDPVRLQKAEENLKQKSQERIQSNYSLDDCFAKN